MDCRCRNIRWKIIYFYIGAIGHLTKKNIQSMKMRAKKNWKKWKKSSMKKYVMSCTYQDVRRSVQKTGDRSSKPVPVPQIFTHSPSSIISKYKLYGTVVHSIPINGTCTVLCRTIAQSKTVWLKYYWNNYVYA